MEPTEKGYCNRKGKEYATGTGGKSIDFYCRIRGWK